MKYALLLALVLTAAPAAAQQTGAPRAPRLTNREQILRERDGAARRLLAPGDSATVYVFALIDERGVALQPEVKAEIDESLKAAAIALVRRMQFTPAQFNGKPKASLLKIPVRFVRPLEK